MENVSELVEECYYGVDGRKIFVELIFVRS